MESAWVGVSMAQAVTPDLGSRLVEGATLTMETPLFLLQVRSFKIL